MIRSQTQGDEWNVMRKVAPYFLAELRFEGNGEVERRKEKD
jgi:hypothetical protein